MTVRPTAAELVEAVHEFVALLGAVETARDRYLLRVADNALAIAAREVQLSAGHAEAAARRWRRLGFADEAALAAAIRRGELDDRLDRVRPELIRTVIERLAISNPAYAEDEPPRGV